MVWVPKAARGKAPTLTTYEIKVTRADLKHELEHPEKSLPWRQYSDFFYLLLSSPILLGDLEVPKDWGVMVLEKELSRGKLSDHLRTIKRAPRLKPIDQAVAMNRVLSFMAWRQYQLGLTATTATVDEAA